MAYATSNPPCMLVQGVGATTGTGQRAIPAIWAYSSADAVTLVRVSGYFTNGWALGMRAGDLVLVLDNDASPLTGSWCWVATATSTAVDLGDGVTITGTNTD